MSETVVTLKKEPIEDYGVFEVNKILTKRLFIAGCLLAFFGICVFSLLGFIINKDANASWFGLSFLLIAGIVTEVFAGYLFYQSNVAIRQLNELLAEIVSLIRKEVK